LFSFFIDIDVFFISADAFHFSSITIFSFISIFFQAPR
jgi:hypothetical protein